MSFDSETAGRLTRLVDAYTVLIEECEREVHLCESLIQMQEQLQRVFESNSENAGGDDE